VAQQQIQGDTGTVDANGELVTYKVPGSVVATPYSVSASVDGTGASGAFLPCLSFYTIAGKLISRAPAPEVASGDTAEVSWFPHVAAAAAAAGASTWVFAYNSGTTLNTIASGTTVDLTGDSGGFYTNSSADFAQGNYSSGGNHYGIRPLTVGHYLGLCYVSVDPGGTFPAVGDNYYVQAALSDGDFEESSFFFGDNRRYAEVASNAWPSDILWGELGTVSDPALDFRKPWIIAFTNNGANTITAYCSTMIVKLDADTTPLD
jgi:hypothetical protein